MHYIPDAREAILDRMGGPAPGSHSQQSIPQKVDKECPLTDIDARHATYSALLDKLTLSPDHRENLLGRGLTDADIQRLGYKTTPVVGMGQIAKQLRSDGLYLAGVPGFYRDSSDAWTFIHEKRGILIPVRDSCGRIQGLQIRRDNVAKRKFRWVSSTEKKDGCKAEGWTHPLSGMVFCADCKASMLRKTVHRGKRTFSYYVCSANKKGNGCSSHSFEQGKLEQTVLRAITKHIEVILDTDALLKSMGQVSIENARIKRLDLAIVQKNSELDRCKDFRMKLYEALNDNLIDRDEYEKMRSKYTNMISEAEAAVRKLEEDREKTLSSAAPRDWMASIAKFKGITELTREVVVTLIDRIYIFEDKHIRIDFNFRNELAYYQEILQQQEVS